MKKLFDSNWFTLTISLLAAIVIWIYVVYETEPVFQTTIKDVPINYVRYSDEITNGKLAVLSKSSDTVDVTVKGERTVLAKVTKNTMSCTVNMADVDVAGTHKIPITVSFDVSGVTLESKDPYNAVVQVDSVITREMDIDVQTKGTPADGYIYDTIEYSTDKIRITGAKSIVEKIKKAQVIVDIAGKRDTQSGRYKIILTDSAGNLIEDKSISRNISYVELSCNILRLKEVPVSVTLSDKTTAAGKKVTVKSVTPEKANILGSRTVADPIDKLKTEEIRVSYVKDGAKIKVKLAPLPAGVRLEDTELEEVEVVLGVE